MSVSRYVKARARERSTWISALQVIGGAASAYATGGNAAAVAAIALGVVGALVPDNPQPGDRIQPVKPAGSGPEVVRTKH